MLKTKIPRKPDSYFKKCKGCGQCCYNIPLPKSLVIAYNRRLVFEPKKWIQLDSTKEMGGDMLLSQDKEGRCPFLTDRNTCNIYEVRPRICRDYGHGGHPYLVCPILEGKANTPVMAKESAGEAIQNALKLPYIQELVMQYFSKNM